MDKSLMLLSSMVCDGNTTTNRQQIIIASTGQFAAGIIGSARSISDRLQKKNWNLVEQEFGFYCAAWNADAV